MTSDKWGLERIIAMSFRWLNWSRPSAQQAMLTTLEMWS